MAVKIVVLDGYTLAPDPQAAGEVNWEPLAALGELTVHDRTPDDQVVARAAGAQAILTNKTAIRAAAIAQLPQLRYIGVLATGYNVVDLEPARQRSIAVTNVPGYSTDSVAQHVLALILELTNHVAAHDRAVQSGRWQESPDFSFTVAPIHELAGKTLAIVGMGAIGRKVAQIAAALGMRIAAAHQKSMASVSIPGVPLHWYPLEELLPQADVLSLHCPLTEQTRNLINGSRLLMMKKSALLINAGRGPLIDEAALAQALHAGQIAGAGLDVLSSEPPAANNPLITAPRCILTPHVAWASVEARQRLMHLAAKNLGSFLAGTPIHVVN